MLTQLLPILSGLNPSRGAARAPTRSYLPDYSRHAANPLLGAFGDSAPLVMLGAQLLDMTTGNTKGGLTDFINSVQANSRVGSVARQQQQLITKNVAGIQMSQLSSILAPKLGVSEGAVATGLGLLGPFVPPELMQLAYTADPTLMFQGGANLVDAARLGNRSGRLRQQDIDALRGQFDAFTMEGKGANLTATQGFYRDEYAAFVRREADLGDRYTGPVYRVGKDGRRVELSKEELAAMTPESRKAAELLSATHSRTGRLASVLQETELGAGLSAEQLTQVMDKLQVGESRDPRRINAEEEMIKQLDALARAAKVSTEELVAMGEIISKNNQTSVLEAATAAGMARVGQRHLSGIGANVSVEDTTKAVADVVGSPLARLAKVAAVHGQMGLAEQIMGGELSSDEAFAALVRATGQTADVISADMQNADVQTAGNDRLVAKHGAARTQANLARASAAERLGQISGTSTSAALTALNALTPEQQDLLFKAMSSRDFAVENEETIRKAFAGVQGFDISRVLKQTTFDPEEGKGLVALLASTREETVKTLEARAKQSDAVRAIKEKAIYAKGGGSGLGSLKFDDLKKLVTSGKPLEAITSLMENIGVRGNPEIDRLLDAIDEDPEAAAQILDSFEGVQKAHGSLIKAREALNKINQETPSDADKGSYEKRKADAAAAVKQAEDEMAQAEESVQAVTGIAIADRGSGTVVSTEKKADTATSASSQAAGASTPAEQSVGRLTGILDVEVQLRVRSSDNNVEVDVNKVPANLSFGFGTQPGKEAQ